MKTNGLSTEEIDIIYSYGATSTHHLRTLCDMAIASLTARRDAIEEAAKFCVDRGVLAEGGKLLTDLRSLAAQEDQRSEAERIADSRSKSSTQSSDHPTPIAQGEEMTESDLDFVRIFQRQYEQFGERAVSASVIERLLRLAETAALIVEHRLDVCPVGEQEFQVWGHHQAERTTTLDAAVRAVATKIREGK